MSDRRPLTLLAFDYGERRIGVATGETLGGSARALETVQVREGRPDWAALERLVRAFEPDRLVVGMPSRADGGEHPLAAAVARFARQLGGRYGLSVDTVDERLSSHEAAARRAAGAGATLDALAAQLILETWMEEYLMGRLST